MSFKKFIGERFYAALRKRNQLRELQFQKYNRLNLNYLSELKTSDTLFILGCGPSINEISLKEWKEIEKHDSFGLNGFLFHETHVPTFYWYEFFSKDIFDYLKFEELELKSAAYKDVPFIFNFADFFSKNHKFDKLPSIMEENHQMFLPKRIYKWDEPALRRIYRNLYKLKSQAKPFERELIHTRGSLATCALIGAMLGYKNIAFPGVDLFGDDYFFYSYDNSRAKEFENFIQRIDVFEKWNQGKVPHRTVQKDLSEKWKSPPIDRILKIMEEEILSHVGGQFYAFSEKSLLSKTFPVYKI